MRFRGRGNIEFKLTRCGIIVWVLKQILAIENVSLEQIIKTEIVEKRFINPTQFQ